MTAQPADAARAAEVARHLQLAHNAPLWDEVPLEAVLAEHVDLHRLGERVSANMVWGHPVTWLATARPPPAARWVIQGFGHLSGPDPKHCRYCGAFAPGWDSPCRPVDCALCGTRQCERMGSNCGVCHYGFLPAWRPGDKAVCGYAGCQARAVARAARVHRACLEHCQERVKVRLAGADVPLMDYVAERVAHRDSGKGWERFRWAEQ